jgi:hypothetical protein
MNVKLCVWICILDMVVVVRTEEPFESSMKFLGGWQESVELRFHRVVVYTNDMEGSLELWTNVMGYNLLLEEIVPFKNTEVPCVYSERNLLQKGVQDGVLLVQFHECREADDWKEPNNGIISIGYVVNDLKEFVQHIEVEEEIVVIDTLEHHSGFDELCYQTPDSVKVCVWEWVHKEPNPEHACVDETC